MAIFTAFLAQKSLGLGFKAISTLGMKYGIRAFKYFVDSTLRDYAVPIAGSVVYCDLYLSVEHSGIYVDNDGIVNIEVDGVMEAIVRRTSAQYFTDKSKLGRKIYVSCDRSGAVGSKHVAQVATEAIGQRSFYGLVIKNCHEFSTKCVNSLEKNKKLPFVEQLKTVNWLPEVTLEPTINVLKKAARKKLGATKWRLWDWENQKNEEEEKEPDWEAHQQFFKRQPLNEAFIAEVKLQQQTTYDYLDEIADESIPETILEKLRLFAQTMQMISDRYEQAAPLLALYPHASLSYNDLEQLNDDFSMLAKLISENPAIRKLTHQMGRSYIDIERKKHPTLAKANQELYGIERNNSIARVLPSELLNLQEERLELLFYAKLLEQNLLSYELSGHMPDLENFNEAINRTGPIVACLDTSSSMTGAPLQKAKALLLAIAMILEQEQRSLYVVLFGAKGQRKEMAIHQSVPLADLLRFLQQGFSGGTDFETPLRHALSVIDQHPHYLKADILMISDGDCTLSEEFTHYLQSTAQRLNCSIYSVLCDGHREKQSFSDYMIIL